ncbi:hypothetical protein JXB11_02415 [Candidatus Woesearchaeota archaeon]|nr:hypothetical protein [Candidatus Woesearchaeota archaeon]
MQPFIERAEKAIRENQDMFLVLEELDRTGKLRKLSYKTRQNFTIDEQVMNKFRSYCAKNSINMSGKVEELIKDFLQKGRNL